MTTNHNLFAAVRQILEQSPALSASQIVDELRGRFDKESPVWLRHSVVHYRSRLKKIREPEYQI